MLLIWVKIYNSRYNNHVCTLVKRINKGTKMAATVFEFILTQRICLQNAFSYLLKIFHFFLFHSLFSFEGDQPVLES